MTSIVSGALMYTVLVANTVALMTDADIPARIYKSKMNDLEEYMVFLKLPKALRIRISSYFQARYQGKWYDEQDVLNWVSSSLREEILMIMCSGLVRKVPMFQNCDVNFISAIVSELQYEVFQEGDVITTCNAPPDRMFFIEHGQVVVDTDSFQQELCDGGYFGEKCLLTKISWLATVRAQTICHLFSLSVDSFYRVLHAYPEVMTDLQRTTQNGISFH
ncbi:potassium/sodium hyperpolarization-activated cyclic nucleotide-gated channel 1-like [Hoplias malabaricus]|uniref:potassium/sodium hyperpolarization-activated cyclic nucleotide-gated channel 1-like n=1 Tax=Hoplias malabaricus TaxID=27720 RepID=UPI003462503F